MKKIQTLAIAMLFGLAGAAFAGEGNSETATDSWFSSLFGDVTTEGNGTSPGCGLMEEKDGVHYCEIDER